MAVTTRIPTQPDTMRRPRTAEQLLAKAQETLSHYVKPNRRISAEKCIDELVNILDGPDAARIATASKSPYGSDFGKTAVRVA